MLKFIKIHKLRKEYEKHLEALQFCIHKQDQLVNTPNPAVFTTEGKAKWWEYNRRADIHRKAYEEALWKLNKLTYGY